MHFVYCIVELEVPSTNLQYKSLLYCKLSTNSRRIYRYRRDKLSSDNFQKAIFFCNFVKMKDLNLFI